MQDTLLLQSEQFNAVMGGITRQYEPIESSILASPLLEELLKFQFCLLPLSPEAKQQPWLIEIHQIRIVATPDRVGQPTPYGRHREGCKYAFHTLIDRSNITGAESIIFDPEAPHEFTVVETALDGTPVYDLERDRILLQNPFDMLALWDEVVKHGTTPALAATADIPQGTRDMLLTFFSYRK